MRDSSNSEHDSGSHSIRVWGQAVVAAHERIRAVDLKLLDQIWSHAPDVSFIYPLGEERGFAAIEQNVFEKAMGGMFRHVT